MLAHGEAKVLITDLEFSKVVKAALDCSTGRNRWSSTASTRTSPTAKSSVRRTTRPSQRRFAGLPGTAADEVGRHCLNYTSGTTGNPKGVVHHHRGAYLNSASNIISWGMPPHSVYFQDPADVPLQRLVLPWTLAANAGTSVCSARSIRP